ncbi:zinc dependent phospholipase C family protein [Dysosmobacter sp.]
MQKRSHKLLASTLLQSQDGFSARRFELAFLFGSFQPDCNPLTYLKGSIRAHKFRGHNYSNSQPYISAHIARLQQRRRWTMWQYYTLGKLTHYLADAFTYPHNEDYPESLLAHRQYEDDLRAYLSQYLRFRQLRRQQVRMDLCTAIEDLHRQYMDSQADMQRDVQYILQATALLMAGCCPAAA